MKTISCGSITKKSVEIMLLLSLILLSLPSLSESVRRKSSEIVLYSADQAWSARAQTMSALINGEYYDNITSSIAYSKSLGGTWYFYLNVQLPNGNTLDYTIWPNIEPLVLYELHDFGFLSNGYKVNFAYREYNEFKDFIGATYAEDVEDRKRVSSANFCFDIFDEDKGVCGAYVNLNLTDTRGDNFEIEGFIALLIPHNYLSDATQNSSGEAAPTQDTSTDIETSSWSAPVIQPFTFATEVPVKECLICRGSGKVTCTLCHGQGSFESGGTIKTCGSCLGMGERICVACMGRGHY